MAGMTPAYLEKALLFGRHQSLVGVLTTPREPGPRPLPTFVFLNAGILHRVGPQRMYVRLARALAEEGARSLRFDLSGIGDSVASPGRAALSPAEMAEQDIDDALEVALRESPTGTCVVIGLCAGADHAFRTLTRDPRVVGGVLLDPDAHRTHGFWVRHYARRLLRWQSWRNALGKGARRLRRPAPAAEGGGDAEGEPVWLAPTRLPPRELMRRQLEALVARRARLLYLFTAGLEDRYNHQGQFQGTFPGLDFGGCLRLEYFADSDHTFTRSGVQERLIALVREWTLGEAFAPAPLPSDARPHPLPDLAARAG